MKILARNRSAVLFRRHGNTYGCLRRARRVTKLNVCCEGERFVLGGTFVGYTYQGSAIGDESSKVGMYDLSTGKQRHIVKINPNGEGPDPEIETFSYVPRMVVTRTGAMAWIVLPPSTTPTGACRTPTSSSPPSTGTRSPSESSTPDTSTPSR